MLQQRGEEQMDESILGNASLKTSPANLYGITLSAMAL
jgi:hypothetical protein